MPSYELINPCISGGFVAKIDKNNEHEAAKHFWSDLSKHISSHLPLFFMTIKKQDGGNGDLYHFSVSEKIVDGSVTANIESIKLTEEAGELLLDKYRNHIGKHHKGGKPEDDEILKMIYDIENVQQLMKTKKKMPIYMFWWYPVIYKIHNPSDYFLPVFSTTVPYYLVAS